MEYRIGIDLGGTNISVGLVDENCRVTAERKAKTRAPRPAAEIISDMAAMISEIREETGVTPVSAGIASPGLIDGRVVLTAGNLRFTNVPLADLLEQATGLPSALHNDATAAVMGEYIAGAGRGFSSVTMVTLGTGVGGGIITNGHVANGIDGRGGEIGHFVLVPDGLTCVCGQRGCFEMYSSATALIRETRAAMEADKHSLLWAEADTLAAVSGRTAFDAMRRGDKTAAAVVQRYVDLLARGLAHVTNTLHPELLVIGGGIAGEGNALLTPVRAAMQRIDPAAAASVQLAISALGRHAAVIGAAYPI